MDNFLKSPKIIKSPNGENFNQSLPDKSLPNIRKLIIKTTNETNFINFKGIISNINPSLYTGDKILDEFFIYIGEDTELLDKYIIKELEKIILDGKDLSEEEIIKIFNIIGKNSLLEKAYNYVKSHGYKPILKYYSSERLFKLFVLVNKKD